MNLAILTSDQNRHKWLAHQLLISGHCIKLLVSEKRLLPKSQGGPDSDLIEAHFKSFIETEEFFFPKATNFPNEIHELITTCSGGLSNPYIQNKIINSNVDYIVVFGSSLIREPLLSAYSGRMINLHQGLSPYYRGSGTNFWPFYNNEIEYVGVTLHFIDKGIDTGEMIAHARPDIQPGDDQYIIGCKTIQSSVDLLLKALDILEQGNVLKTRIQHEKGKLYQRSDFNADAVRRVNELIDRGIVNDYCSMVAQGNEPKIQLLDLEVA